MCSATTPMTRAAMRQRRAAPQDDAPRGLDAGADGVGVALLHDDEDVRRRHAREGGEKAVAKERVVVVRIGRRRGGECGERAQAVVVDHVRFARLVVQRMAKQDVGRSGRVGVARRVERADERDLAHVVVELEVAELRIDRDAGDEEAEEVGVWSPLPRYSVGEG